MEFASCSILRPQSFSSIFHYTNSHLYAFPKTHLNLGASPFSPAFPKDSTFPGKCLHFHRFTAFSSLSGADDRNPSQELAVLLEVDGVLIDAYRLGNRQTFNVAFKKLGLDCANWTEPVYVDLLRKCAGDEEKMLIMYFNRIGWPSSLPTTEKESFVKNVLQKKVHIYKMSRDDNRRTLAKYLSSGVHLSGIYLTPEVAGCMNVLTCLNKILITDQRVKRNFEHFKYTVLIM